MYQQYDPRSYDERLKEYIIQQRAKEYSGLGYPQQEEAQGGGNPIIGLGGSYLGKKGGEMLYDAAFGGGATTGTSAGGGLLNSIGASAGGGLSDVASNAGGINALGSEGTSLSNFAGSATPYLGGAGVALGTYGAIKGIKDKNPLGAGLGGAGIGLGLNAMGLALGPVGWAAMLASPIAMALINKMGDKDRWKEEQSRRNKLAESGVTGWSLYNSKQPQLTKGRSFASMHRGDLAKDFIGFAGKDGKSDWVNNKFNSSRDVKDLRPEDIWGYSAFGEKYGNDWFGKFNENQRRDIAKTYLDAGAVTEGRGQIALKADTSLDDKIKKYLEGSKKK